MMALVESWIGVVSGSLRLAVRRERSSLQNASKPAEVRTVVKKPQWPCRRKASQPEVAPFFARNSEILYKLILCHNHDCRECLPLTMSHSADRRWEEWRTVGARRVEAMIRGAV